MKNRGKSGQFDRAGLLVGLAGSAILAGLAAPTDAAAQSTAPADASTPASGIEDIVVTAQRTSQLLQDVPVSVTTVSNATLIKNQINTIQQLGALAPSFSNFVNRGDTTTLAISLRGVSSNNLGLIADPTVGVYINGIYLARASGQGLGLVDMASVEILTGPQGTLFGRNTIGGALNLTTQRPTDDFSGEVELGAGNYASRYARGVLNAPIVNDKVAVRLVYLHDEHDGYAYNESLKKDFDYRKTDYVRGSVRLSLGDWNSLTVADWVHSKSSVAATRVRFVDLTRPANLNVPVVMQSGGTDNIANYINGPFRTVYGLLDDQQSVRNWGVSHTLTHSFGDVNFTAITGYRHLRLRSPQDSLGIPYRLVFQPVFGENQKQFSQEIQLDGKLFDGALEFVTGAIYFRESGGDFFYTLSANFLTGALPTTASNVYPRSHNRSVGGFAQATWNFTPKLSLTGGIRYSNDRRRVLFNTQSLNYPSYTFRNCIFPPASLGYSIDPATCFVGPVKAKFGFVPWMVSLNYKPDGDLLFYGKVSRGYRSGGFPPGAAPLAGFYRSFEPESLTSFEIGAKSTLFDRHVRLNAAVYRSSYHNIQLQSLQGTPPQPTISNFGNARIWGAEADLTLKVGVLQLRSIAAYIDAKYTSGPFFTGVPGQNIARNPYQFTPKYTLNQSVDVDLPIEHVGNLNLHGEYSYRSRIYFAPLLPSAPATWPFEAQNGYGLLDASMTLRLADQPFSFRVWGRNLAGKKYYAGIVDGASRAGYVSGYLGDPRTYGATATVLF